MKNRVRLLGIAAAVVLLAAACGDNGKTPSLNVDGEDVQAGDGAGADGSSGPCVPNCKGKQCGDSGCPGYSCGYCGAGMYCDEQFQCGIGACTPGKTKCVEGGLSTCNEDGLAWGDPVPCPEGDECVDNACVPPYVGCEPGETRCIGNEVQLCDENGEWEPPIACPDVKVCVDGTCVDPGTKICQPGETRCKGDAVETCNGDGTKWSTAVPCPDGQVCEAGVCKVPAAKDCQDLLFCMTQKNCGDAEGSCMVDCLGGASIPVQNQAMAVYDCIFDICGKWGPSEPCFQTQQITGCAAEFAACKESTCEPSCAGKQCGGDGCGGSCGTCPTGQTCTNGKCVGGSNCNGITYEGCCDANTLNWCEDGQLKTQDCSWDPKCGWNGQQGFYDCGTQGATDPSGTLPKACPGSCQPNCGGKQCGPDGCGGSCGGCPPGSTCQEGTCQGGCTPNCSGKQCGPDGCGGSCGNCPEGQSCNNGVCQGSSGTGCANISMCAVACNFGESCLTDCWNKGDPQAKQLFQNLLTCVGEACGGWITEQCLWNAIQGGCKAAYDACMND